MSKSTTHTHLKRGERENIGDTNLSPFQNEGKTAKLHTSNISRLVSIAIGSAKIKKLVLQEKNGPKQIRAQMHVILRARTGAGKSTILAEIAKHEGREVVDEITRAGLVGSIDQRVMQLIPGAAWTYRNGIVPFDEFRFRRQSDDWVVFLKLLEDQTYSRKLGVFSSTLDLQDGDLYLRQRDGQIKMRTRFAAVIGTMRNFKLVQSLEFKAFINRCVPYQYDFTDAELEGIARGDEIVKIKEYKPDEEIEIKKSAYFKIVRFVRNYMRVGREATRKENFLRAVGDLCRVRAVEGDLSLRFAKQIIDWKVRAYDEIGAYYGRKK